MKVLDLDIPTEDTPVLNDGLQPSDGLIDGYLKPLSRELKSRLNEKATDFPHIDYDELKDFLARLLNGLPEDLVTELRKIGRKKPISKADWGKNPELKAIWQFLAFYPHFANLIQNIHLNADTVIRSTAVHFQEPIDTENFIKAKKFIDEINRKRWTRPQSDSEQQSGVSNLGAVSEALLEQALDELIDNKNFYRTTNNKIQSYGDFVLMCLPNNLWLSVKSNFARERLLASGYTTDILGVGFFTDKKEFTSAAKVRNFQRVGFLAMYLPDVPISEKQVKDDVNTFDLVKDYYERDGRTMPLNINGTSFIRPLSDLHRDLQGLLDIADIANRTTIDF